jgi:hypothetical protein
LPDDPDASARGRNRNRFAGAIPMEEIEQIRQAIDQDCERMNPKG